MDKTAGSNALDQVLVVVSGKINLYLRILESCNSGYHLIETLFQSIDLRDEVLLKRNAGGINLSIEPEDQEGIPRGTENIACRAAERFFQETGQEEGVDITIRKHIPVGGGLGGGGADGAAALRGLSLLYGSPLPETSIYRLAGELGSDVPFLLYGGSSLAWGRGDRLIPLRTVPSLNVGVCYPGFEVSSQSAYHLMDEMDEIDYPGTDIVSFDNLNQEEWILSHLHNDFEKVIFARHPELKEIKDAFLGMGAEGSLLAGSGSSVFGIFRDQKQMSLALEKIEKTFPVDAYESSFLEQGMVIEIPMVD